MEQNINLTPLHPYLKTRVDANKLLELFEKIISGLFKDTAVFDDVLSKETSLDLKLIIEKIAQESNVDTSSAKEVELFLRKFQENISLLPIIHVLLAFEPKEGLVSTIHDWFYQNYNKTILLDISVDKSLIAGGVISYAGKANDYSLRGKIEQISNI